MSTVYEAVAATSRTDCGSFLITLMHVFVSSR